MADKQYYVKMNFEFGTDVDGVLTPKNNGSVEWLSMPYEAAVILQNQAIIPTIAEGLAKAGALGYEATDAKVPGKPA